MALITWAETSVAVNVGDTVTVDFIYGKEYGEYFDTRITTSDTGVATITTSGQYSQFGGTATITGVSAGTATVVPGPRDTQNTPLTITVTAPTPADDQNFLNERGLAHFWQGVDAAKQDKLPSGTVLTTRTELYNNNSGSAANIAVSQALNNFDLVEFWFIDANSPANQLVRTIPGDAAGVVLDIPHPGGNSGVFWNIARWTWTAGATTLTYSSNHYQKALAASSLSTSSTNYILIRKVVGIKFTTL